MTEFSNYTGIQILRENKNRILKYLKIKTNTYNHSSEKKTLPQN